MTSPYRDDPATVEQLAAALAALDSYAGTGSAAEHAAEAIRLGGRDAYRLRLANALLGAAQMHALLAERLAGGDTGLLAAAHREQLATSGVLDPATGDADHGKLAEFLRWQVLRVGAPLREVAQDAQTGPIPVAAAHTADALQKLLGAIAAGHAMMSDLAVGALTGAAVQEIPVEAIEAQRDELADARDRLQDAITNTEILIDMLDLARDAYDGPAHT